MISFAKTPKNVRKPIKVIKKCFEPGCGKEFKGIKIQKYCDDHRDPNKRVKKARRRIFFEENVNRIFKHNFMESMFVEFYCEYCNNVFRVKAIPKVYIYPRFCETHRPTHKRRIPWKEAVAMVTSNL